MAVATKVAVPAGLVVAREVGTAAAVWEVAAAVRVDTAAAARVVVNLVVRKEAARAAGRMEGALREV